MAVPILVFHRVTDSPVAPLREYAVSTAGFRRQMRALRLAGWRTATVGELVEARRAGRRIPRRTVAITFDDAYAELEQEALPVLARNGQTATIYACPGLLGASSDSVLGDGGLHEGATLMDAAALRRADAAGFAVESHSSTHPRLTSLDDARLIAEVAGSRGSLAEVLGREVRHFAYPFGNYDDRVAAAVAAAGYESAVTTDHGAMSRHDLLRLPRVYVSWGVGAIRLVARVARRAGEG